MNVLYVATMQNTLYAFDANAWPEQALLWSVNLGPPVPSDAYGFRDIYPQIGILSTPVIDLESQTIYLVANTWDGNDSHFHLHALDLATGEEKSNAPVEISAEGFEPFWHLQRPGLLLTGGTVYIAFGSHGDDGPFHGWLMAQDASDVSRQMAVWNAAPTGGGSIWQSGRGPAADEFGRVYVVTANGHLDGVVNFSESAVRLSSSLLVEDWFAPSTWELLNEEDGDFGACGPVLIPGTRWMVTGGKDGMLFVLNRERLGGVSPGNPSAVDSQQGSGIFTMATWPRGSETRVYVQGFGDVVKMYSVTSAGKMSDVLAQGQEPGGFPTQGMAISALGGVAGTGILWVSSSDDVLHAYDAMDVSRELWNSATWWLDDLGAFAKFATPTVANGRVYVPTFAGQVAVYGLRADANPF